MPYRYRSGVVVTDLDDELVLLDTDSKTIFSLNTVGRFVWRACDGHDLNAVIALVSAHYDVAPDRARVDVAAVVDELLRNNLIAHHGD